ncbi:hypothetical protein Tco_0811280 [Tanacetum coccineum]
MCYDGTSLSRLVFSPKAGCDTKSLPKALDLFTTEAVCVASDLNKARRAEARKSDQIVVAQSYLGDIHSMLQSFKRSIVEKCWCNID